MNILFVYPTPFNPIKGGVERVTFLLAREFVGRGHQVFFLHNYHSDHIDFPFEVKIDYFPYEEFSDIRNIEWYHDYLKNNNIDIVINQCGQFGDSKLYCNTGGYSKVISVAHMSPEINLNCLFSEISRLRGDGNPLEPIKRIVRVLIYPYIYHKEKQLLKRHYNWIADKTDRFVVLSKRFFTDLRRLSNADLHLAAISNPLSFIPCLPVQKDNIVLWVGRMDKQKRPDLMIKIWRKAKLNNWRLIMIGDGKLMAKTKKEAIGIENIELIGFSDPLPYYRKAKILCMTSGHEGFGMVLTEAMSQGCIPMAFSSFSSVHDIIPDTERLVRPFCVKEFVKKLRTLANNADFNQWAVRCVEDSKQFEIKAIVNQWENLFNELVSK